MNKLAEPYKSAAGGTQAPSEGESMLAVLMALDGTAHTTQRNIANRAGVALGLANALIKRCVRKGLVKISQAPARRYIYYLTPEGFAEKSRLMAEYLSSSLDFFRQARGEYAKLFATCERRGWRRVALVGVGELAEIALLSGADTKLDFVVIEEGEGDHFQGRPVFASLEEAGAVDAVIVSDTKDPQARYAAMVAKLGQARVFAPSFLYAAPANGAGGSE